MQREDGVGVAEAASVVSRRKGALVFWHFQGGNYLIIPFFREANTAALRTWYQYRPAAPTLGSEDDWIPFDGRLPGHLEILAVGAALKCQMRQGESPGYASLYSDLYGVLVEDVESRQVQRSKHVVSSEEFYP